MVPAVHIKMMLPLQREACTACKQGTECECVFETGMERVDGLQGPLIIKPAGADALAGQYDEDKVVLMTDWYHDLYGPLAFANARYFITSVTFSNGTQNQTFPSFELVSVRTFLECRLPPKYASLPPWFYI